MCLAQERLGALVFGVGLRGVFRGGNIYEASHIADFSSKIDCFICILCYNIFISDLGN